MTLKATRRNKRGKSMLKLNKLMKDVWMTINSVSKQLVWKLRATKSRSIYSHIWHQVMIVEPFQKATCPPEFLNKWKHFRTRFSENMISMNCTYTQNSILRKAVRNTYNWSYEVKLNDFRTSEEEQQCSTVKKPASFKETKEQEA
jgi:hypothetical protein